MNGQLTHFPLTFEKIELIDTLVFVSLSRSHTYIQYSSATFQEVLILIVTWKCVERGLNNVGPEGLKREIPKFRGSK